MSRHLKLKHKGEPNVSEILAGDSTSNDADQIKLLDKLCKEGVYQIRHGTTEASRHKTDVWVQEE